jgi:hypothetical protein
MLRDSSGEVRAERLIRRPSRARWWLRRCSIPELMLGGAGKGWGPGRPGRVKEIQRRKLSPVGKEGDRRCLNGGRDPGNRETVEEVSARESQGDPETPPPPWWRPMGAASVGVPGPSAGREDDVGRPRRRTPSKGEQTEARTGKMSHTPDDQMPKEAIQRLMNREMEQGEPDSGTNPKREARTEEKVDDR